MFAPVRGVLVSGCMSRYGSYVLLYRQSCVYVTAAENNKTIKSESRCHAVNVKSVCITILKQPKGVPSRLERRTALSTARARRCERSEPRFEIVRAHKQRGLRSSAMCKDGGATAKRVPGILAQRAC